MNLRTAIQESKESIDHIYGPSEAQNISRYYFEDRFGISNPELELSADQLDIWKSDLKDLVKGIPLQYVVGVAHFYGYQFLVGPDVLIPRAETEELVRHCIQLLKTYDRPVKILDIGTGSGCIPISIKLTRPSTTMITAIDVSRAALRWAIDNSQTLDAHVLFKEVNILDDGSCKDLDQYDIIISNPPYIPFEEEDRVASWVKDHEPELALFVNNEDPLLFYKRILDLSRRHLKLNGYVLFEVNEFNANDVAKLAKEHFPNAEVDILKDLQNKDRIISLSL